MRQPAALKTQEYVPWSKGVGHQVWAMLSAVIEGDLEKVQSLAQNDRQLLTCEYEYFTPMHFAVRENHINIVQFLVERGVNVAYSPGESLFCTAEDRGYSELITYLNEILKTKYRISPEGDIIGNAIRNGDIDETKTLIENNDDMIHTADAKGNQPIHWAAYMENVRLIDYLLTHGADINAPRPDGARAIDLANIYLRNRTWHVPKVTDHFERSNQFVTFLIERGAHCDIGTAARIGNYNLVKEMVEKDRGSIKEQPSYSDYFSGLPLRMAAGAGYESIVELLLQHGANPNESEPGVAPAGGALHAAIWGQHLDIAKLLLRHGANVDAEVESSGDAVFMAEWMKSPYELITLLRRNSKKALRSVPKANHFNELIASGASSVEQFIDHFIREDLRDHISMLLKSDGDILRNREYDPNAWWDSFTFKSADSARWLLERGLPANRHNWLDITPLHRASRSGDIVIAELLLGYGADINAVDTEWFSTPLGWAVKNRQKDMVEWLLRKGARTNVVGQRPWSTPSSWAARKGFNEMLEILNS